MEMSSPASTRKAVSRSTFCRYCCVTRVIRCATAFFLSRSGRKNGLRSRPMAQQHLPLSGLDRIQIVDNAAPTTIHTLDQTDQEKGGPYYDEITLFANNTTAGTLDL